MQAAWLLALTPFIAAERGAAELGTWTVAMAVYGYLQLLDLGIGVTVARFVAADPGAERRRAVVSTVVCGLVLVAIAGALLGLAVVVAAPSLFDSDLDVGAAVAVAVAGSVLQLPLRPYGHALYGLERIVERNAFTTVRWASSFAATVGGVLAGLPLPAYLALALGCELVLVAAQVRWTARRFGLAPDIHAVDRRLAAELLRFGLPTFGLQAATQVVLYSDAIVIGAALGVREAGVYAVAMRLVEGTGLLLGQIADVFLPVFSRMPVAEAAGLARRGSVGLLLLASVPVGVLIGAGAPLVELWVGDGYAAAQLPLVLLAVTILFNAPLRLPVVWTMSAGRHGPVARLALAEAAVNVALSVVLVFPLGVDGVALATLTTVVVSNGWLIPRLLSRELGARYATWYLGPVARCVAALAIPCAVARLVLASPPS